MNREYLITAHLTDETSTRCRSNLIIQASEILARSQLVLTGA